MSRTIENTTKTSIPNSADLWQSAGAIRLLFESSPDFIFVSRIDNLQFVHVNNRACTHYGYTLQEFLKMEIFDIEVGEPDREQVLQLYRDTPVGEVIELEGINKRKDGSMFPAQVRFCKLDDRYATATVRDITRQKAMDAEFERQVEDRSAKLRRSEERLLQAQKMQSLGKLAGGLAHDLNNMLTPILGYAQLVAENLKAGTKDAQYVNSILASGKQAKDIVAQVLLFVRHSQTKKTVTDLRPLVNAAINFVRSIPSASSHKITCDISDTSGYVIGDSSQIYQALINLCLNAAHSITGSGKIHISLSNVDLDKFPCLGGQELTGQFMRIAVRDTGSGIREKDLDHIFEPFFTTKGIGKGTGLGLSIVSGVVQSHEGSIAVSTAPGKGTTIEIFLPMVKGDLAKMSDDVIAVKGKERILFVGDEEPVAELGKISLEQYGYSVTIINNGKEAMDQFVLRPGEFDLIVTDFSMPKISGVSLVEALRAEDPNIPVILCTGYSDVISPKLSKAMGIDSFLYKPVTLRELGRAVREVLARTTAC